MKKAKDLVYLPMVQIGRPWRYADGAFKPAGEVYIDAGDCWPVEMMYIGRSDNRIAMKMASDIVIESFI